MCHECKHSEGQEAATHKQVAQANNQTEPVARGNKKKRTKATLSCRIGKQIKTFLHTHSRSPAGSERKQSKLGKVVGGPPKRMPGPGRKQRSPGGAGAELSRSLGSLNKIKRTFIYRVACWQPEGPAATVANKFLCHLLASPLQI